MPKVPAKVYAPSPEAYNRHCAIHLPYTNWCPICVPAKKRNTARKHNASDEASKHVPVIAMDHVYMNEVTDDTDNPILVIGDSCCEGIWAVRIKKGGDTAAVKNIVANFLRGFVYSKVVPKSDQEPANRSMERNAVEILFETTSRRCVVAKS